MNTMVEMRLETRHQGGCERLSCDLEFWGLMIDLGEAFGWKPLGSTYVAKEIRRPRESTARKRDYAPGMWRDAKRVEREDALKWAIALANARSSPHLRKLTALRRDSTADPNCGIPAHSRQNNAALLSAMDDFIGYLHKGAFSFAAGDNEEIASMDSRK